MRFNFGSLLILVCFASSLFSCLDHRLGGTLSPVRLRLTTVQSGTTLTTYTYDSQNRLATIAKSDGSIGVLSYDDAGKKYINFSEYPNAADRTTGRLTPYPYNLDGTSFKTYRYAIIRSTVFYDVNDATFDYEFDANKHLTRYYSSGGRDDVTTQVGISSIIYNGENIASSTSYGLRITSPALLNQYDNKINPFFDLLDPGIDPILRFSRNNVVQSIYTANSNFPDISSLSRTYEYEYNQQNLPVKRTTKQAGTGTVIDVTTFSYESY